MTDILSIKLTRVRSLINTRQTSMNAACLHLVTNDKLCMIASSLDRTA